MVDYLPCAGPPDHKNLVLPSQFQLFTSRFLSVKCLYSQNLLWLHGGSGDQTKRITKEALMHCMPKTEIRIIANGEMKSGLRIRVALSTLWQFVMTCLFLYVFTTTAHL